MSTGPYLYDEGPENLHTGTPRNRNRLLLAVFGGTVLLGVLLVLLTPVIKGTPEEQAREVAGVFLAALQQGDTETSHLLLCEEERYRLQPGQVAGEYLTGDDGRVVDATEGRRNGDSVQLVQVRWADGGTSEWTVIAEKGPHVCGLAPTG